MASSTSPVFIAVAFLVIINAGMVYSDMQCYNCNSASDDRCSENWPWTNFANPPPTTNCIGQCTKIVAGIGDKSITTRGCNPLCVPGKISFGVSSYTVCCKSDKCNSSNVARMNIIAMIFMAIAAILWKNL